TSGGFSPTLERSIALARVESAAGLKLGDTCQVEVRGKALNARVVKANFVREGQALVDL
ncbi:MAG: glycine cleavage T C-terminal barrel domain-containing protein, partial [Gammaproteobacteria bacterium]